MKTFKYTLTLSTGAHESIEITTNSDKLTRFSAIAALIQNRKFLTSDTYTVDNKDSLTVKMDTLDLIQTKYIVGSASLEGHSDE